MPPTIITKESLYKRITELERKHCCNKNQFFDTFADFPAEGAAGVLYINKETEDIYIWDTLNEEYVLLNHTKTAKTVYVDGTYGDDTTGQRESRDFPFQTLDAAIAVCETGDLLKVFPGDYTQTVTIPVLINIDCDNGVNWLVNTATFIATADFAAALNIKWNFYKLYGITAAIIRFSNSLGDIEINANEFNLVDCIANARKHINKIVNHINSRCMTSTLIASGVETGWSNVIDNLERTVSQNWGNFSVEGKDFTKGFYYIRNLKSVNSLIGWGGRSTITYYFATDGGINKQYTTIIDNVTHDDPNIYVTPPGPIDNSVSWRGASAGAHAGLLLSTGQAHRDGNVIINEIKNIKSTGHGIRIASNTTGNNITVIVKIKGVFEKGIPVYSHALGSITNSKIIIDLDVECHTSMGLFLGFDSAGSGNNIGATNQIIVTGRIKTRYAGMSCISIGTGSGASNNTNGTILLKDLTLINDGTVSPIMCGVAENVLIQNVVTNSLVVDPNITEVGQSIIRNVNYK